MNKIDFENAFMKAWDVSGLPEYYTRTDDLKNIGFKFDVWGDMDYWQSEAISEWLEDLDKSILEVSFEQIKANKNSILELAKIIKHEDDRGY